jgi:hypothetical protein
VDRLSFWEYVREAFHRRVKVPLLGQMPANKMALGTFAVLGLANPGFWLLGAALEVSYLFLLAGSERFQKVVDGERLLQVQEAWRDKVHRGVNQLSPAGRQRYRHLLAQCRRILGISETLGSDSLGNFRDLRARSLNQLLSIFLKLLTSRELIVTNVQELDRAGLDQETQELERRIESLQTGSPLRRSLEGTLEIHRRRLDNWSRAGQSLKVIDAELERIEKQVELVREESAVGQSPEFLSSRLDAVASTMSETNRWMEQQADLFGSLGGDEVTPALLRLPELPVEKE